MIFIRCWDKIDKYFALTNLLVGTFRKIYQRNIKMCSVNEFSTKLDRSIRNIIEKEGYLLYRINNHKVPMSGNGFLSEIYKVDIKGETSDGEQETNLFLKTLPQSKDVGWISLPGIYRTELFAYRDLSDIFAELQEDANVPSQERFKMVKCYEESDREMIILENIVNKGYKAFQRTNVITLEFAEMAVKQLARFHGLSFALEKRQPEYFDKKIKEMKYPFINGSEWQAFVKNMISKCVKYVDDDVKCRVEKGYQKLASKYNQYFNNDAMNISLCHGDYRPCNMFIKTYNERITDMILVDHQILHYGCPVLDFIQFVFMSTDRKFRKAHLSHLKDLYHDTLRTFLEYFNIDVELVYPRSKFEMFYTKMSDFGLLISFVFLPFVLATNEDIPDLIEESLEFGFPVTDIFINRQRDLIEDFMEWGYI